MHWEKLSGNQIVFYSIRIRRLNALCFHRLIAIRKDAPIKFFQKKRFCGSLVKQKENFFFGKNKMILAHRALFFHLTLKRKSI